MTTHRATPSLKPESILLTSTFNGKVEVDGFNICGYIIPLLIEACKNHWIGSKKNEQIVLSKKFTYQISATEIKGSKANKCIAFLLIRTAHKNLRQYETFASHFRVLFLSSIKRMTDCCTFVSSIENGRVSLWRFDRAKYLVKIKMEEQLLLLTHSISVMVTELID